MVLEGEVDIYSSRQFEEALLRGIREGATRVIIDLVEVAFIDSTALGVMVGGLRAIGAQEGALDSSAATNTSETSSRSLD